MKGIVITTCEATKPFLDDLLHSLKDCKYTIIVVYNNSNVNYYESIGLQVGMNTFTDFIYLHDTVVIKDLALFDKLFEYDMCSISPGYLMYLGKYNSTILRSAGLWLVQSKMEAVNMEMKLKTLFGHYPCLDPLFIDGNHTLYFLFNNHRNYTSRSPQIFN